ncbi:MAG: hypothetical protein ACLQM6_02865 [Acidobacteriaceae bacterium]
MTMKSGLVCQHLEHINVRALEQYQHIIHAYVRQQEGVYALYKKGRLYYVGLASDLKWRLGAHLKDRHKQKWDSFSVYLTGNDQHLKELESLLLRVVLPKPKGNKQSGKFALSENLLRQFKRDIKEYQKKEYGELIGLAPKQSKQARGKVDSLLAGYVQRTGNSLQLRAVYKGKTYRAFLLKDGSIRFKNRKYMSPSAAGREVIQRACNGWAFWRYQTAPGQWVRLSALRSK